VLGSGCKVWDLSTILVMGWQCGIYKALNSPTTIARFYGVVLQRVFQLVLQPFHHVSVANNKQHGWSVSIVMFAHY